MHNDEVHKRQTSLIVSGVDWIVWQFRIFRQFWLAWIFWQFAAPRGRCLTIQNCVTIMGADWIVRQLTSTRQKFWQLARSKKRRVTSHDAPPKGNCQTIQTIRGIVYYGNTIRGMVALFSDNSGWGLARSGLRLEPTVNSGSILWIIAIFEFFQRNKTHHRRYCDNCKRLSKIVWTIYHAQMQFQSIRLAGTKRFWKYLP